MKKSLYQLLSPTLAKLYRLMGRVKVFELAIDYFFFKLFPNSSIPFLSARGTGSMERDWDERAKLNALISATGCADEKDAEDSAVKGLQTLILKGVGLDRGAVVLEIGCGIGNLLKPLSALVKEAYGVDISGEMLRRAKERLRDCSNIALHKTDGRLNMLPDNYFDFVFSSGVFIHFPSKLLVYEYFKEVARVLKPGGIFRFHVDGRSYLKWRRQKGSTLRGVVFSPAEIRKNLEEWGFQVQEITGENSMEMWTTAILPKS